MDRTEWPSGPWDTEPDTHFWITAVGLPGWVRRGWAGTWCGYAGVGPSSDFYGLHYDDAYAVKGASLDVHGGLTYSGGCSYPDVQPPWAAWWYFGFDCNHLGDGSPTSKRGIYRDLEYVKREVELLAAQLVPPLVELLAECAEETS